MWQLVLNRDEIFLHENTSLNIFCYRKLTLKPEYNSSWRFIHSLIYSKATRLMYSELSWIFFQIKNCWLSTVILCQDYSSVFFKSSKLFLKYLNIHSDRMFSPWSKFKIHNLHFISFFVLMRYLRVELLIINSNLWWVFFFFLVH